MSDDNLTASETDNYFEYLIGTTNVPVTHSQTEIEVNVCTGSKVFTASRPSNADELITKYVMSSVVSAFDLPHEKAMFIRVRTDDIRLPRQLGMYLTKKIYVLFLQKNRQDFFKQCRQAIRSFNRHALLR